MHELSIAQNILELVTEHVPEPRRPLVRVVRVKVGAASGVVPESLEFCFVAAASEGPFAGARIDIEPVPFLVRCGTCSAESTNDSGIPVCAACGAPAAIVSGTELQVREIELDEPTAGTS